VAPLQLARDRVLQVPGAMGRLLPGGAIQRGSVVSVAGTIGSGATSAVLGLAAAATRAGEWSAVVEAGDLLGVGGVAAAEAGVDLDRFAAIREVPSDRWATVVAALLDGVSVVVAGVPRGARAGDARRLVARARERGAVLVPVGTWPASSVLRIRAGGGQWPELDDAGFLSARPLLAQVEGRSAPPSSIPLAV
jgi:RecA/RadA recombinase